MGSSKRYRPWLPKQNFLLPPSPSDWLPKNHLVHFMLDVIEVLDLDSIEAEIQSKDPRGTSPYDPRMMVAQLTSQLRRGGASVTAARP